ncbi:uncharacterized protein LOC113854283 [Abrus precatorius]|uniref:Uncharacterized protein LOC113854283 n=1 Tax=Abrus precatorius TaxID=3816 RepID=A0A8B8KD61_ABRPR|nr:uncharacterized protein LOC113854283 [Abrus precatorius]
MVNPIPEFAKKVWSKWNIRGVILVSLTLQIILIFMAPMRKRTKKSILVMLLWSTYLLADYTANFCVGLISNKYADEDKPSSTINDFVLAFWTPFLLLHLGGPDTITAFSLEDNELWLRHMLGLIVQVCLTSYVFLLTLPENTLWLPTTFVFLAGIIKFAERTRSLQLASVSNFRQSMVRKPDPGPNYAKLMEELKSRRDAGLPAKIVKMPEIADPILLDTNTSQQFQKLEEASTSAKHGVQDESKDESDGNSIQETTKVARDNEQEENLCDVEVVRDAYNNFVTFKGLVVDMIFSFHERSDSRNYFIKLTAVDALRVIEVELNFIYEAFYSKASVLFNKVGFLFRFVSVSSVVAALVLFVFDQKQGCNEFDVKVTYTLLYGAVALDVVSLYLLISSDHTFASFNSLGSKRNDFVGGISAFKDSIFRGFLKFKRPIWITSEVKSPTWLRNRKKTQLCRHVIFRRWSESISGFNLVSYCLQKKRTHWLDKVIDYIGAKELVEQWKYEKKQPLLQELWIFIFKELKRKSEDVDDVETIQRICSSRGEWVIQEGELLRDDIDKLMPHVDRNIVTFDECLILWHIATDLLFYEVEEDVEKGNHNVHKSDQDGELKDLSKILSDYMLYLLIMQPTMMSSVRGIGQIRFQDTCVEATNFFSKREMMSEVKALSKPCMKLMDVCVEVEPSAVKGDRSKSLLFDACILAHKLKQLKGMKKWKIIAQVWVELLSYAASNCIPITHVQQLCKGGEFLSLVWLLMTHLGLAKQFQIKEGHARAKLIVEE